MNNQKMTTKSNDTSSQKRSTYYDEIFSRIQEMERKYFEEENEKNCSEYLKNFKPSNTTFNLFSSYKYELSRETINA
jgi:hypothetical protein